MRLSKRTIEFSVALYPAASQGGAHHNGKQIPGMRFPCYLHPEFIDREVYLATPPELCTVLLNDDIALHLNGDGEVAWTEDAEGFVYKAKRWLQPWRTLKEICAEAEVERRRPWTWDTLLRAGAITLLAGPPKLGKSTLVFDMLAALASSRGECLGLSLTKANVLYVTEEGPAPLADKGATERLKAIQEARYIAFLTSFEAGGDWPGLLQLIDRAVVEMTDSQGFLPSEYPLVVIIDTLGFFMGLDDENAAGQVRTGLKMLVDRVRDKNFACLLLTHARKAGAKDDQWVSKIQGSTAYAGNVDIVAALDGNYGSKERRLFRVGRFGVYDPVDLTFSKEEGYQAMTEPEKQARHRTQLNVVRAMLDVDPKIGKRKVANECGFSESTAARILKEIRGEEEK